MLMCIHYISDVVSTSSDHGVYFRNFI